MTAEDDAKAVESYATSLSMVEDATGNAGPNIIGPRGGRCGENQRQSQAGARHNRDDLSAVGFELFAGISVRVNTD